ncbi:MAG TPA: iron-sulfur cluster assembly scaffold protein [Desulfobacterales bacterium]|nr:iron-sulfur cluster assembly scaffold protein [Desulfobacterales bacterium]
MGDNLDNFVQQLQDQIFEETKKDFGEKVYKRWREPLYMGVIDEPDGHAKVKGKCGDSIEIFLKFENNRITQASFLTDGCGPSVVCGSYAAEMAIGKDPDELVEITGKIILEKLGGLPEENEHCAFLAAESLQQALNDYMINQAS